MAPDRRVTERMSQLVASPPPPSAQSLSLAGWVAYGGPGRNPIGVTHKHTHSDTHMHTERHTEGLEPPRLDPRSPWETQCHQASDRGGGFVYVCVWVIPPCKSPPPFPPENVGHRPPHHIPMVTPLLSLLIKIREIYLCVHTHT